jgi:hypothetical protein
MLMFFAAVALSACAVFSDGSKPLPFELRGSSIVVPVTIDGEGPFRFLLDTGASRSIVSRRLLGPHPVEVARTTMVTPAGRSTRPVSLAVLRLGNRAPTPVAATIVADAELKRSTGQIDGIVGQDVLSHLVYTIDYARKEIRWDGESDMPAAARLPLRIEDGRALVIVPPSRTAGSPLRLIPDTAADGLVIFRRRGGSLPLLTPLEVGSLRTLGGGQLVRRILVDRLPLGSFALRDHPAVLVDVEDDHQLLGDGLLALHQFSRVTFNGPEGYMVVER